MNTFKRIKSGICVFERDFFRFNIFSTANIEVNYGIVVAYIDLAYKIIYNFLLIVLVGLVAFEK